MLSMLLAILAVLAALYFVPLLVYGVASALGWTEPPQNESVRAFMLGVLVTKIGTAMAFALLLKLGGEVWTDEWVVYALIWFGMFAASEIGDGISGRSTWPDAILGIASEAVYSPVAAYAATKILGVS